MHFSFSAVAAIVAMATSAIAQTANFDSVTYPTSDEVIDAGSTYTIKWTTPAQYAGDTISISLIGGATQDTQIPIMTIASTLKQGLPTRVVSPLADAVSQPV